MLDVAALEPGLVVLDSGTTVGSFHELALARGGSLRDGLGLPVSDGSFKLEDSFGLLKRGLLMVLLPDISVVSIISSVMVLPFDVAVLARVLTL